MRDMIMPLQKMVRLSKAVMQRTTLSVIILATFRQGCSFMLGEIPVNSLERTPEWSMACTYIRFHMDFDHITINQAYLDTLRNEKVNQHSKNHIGTKIIHILFLSPLSQGSSTFYCLAQEISIFYCLEISIFYCLPQGSFIFFCLTKENPYFNAVGD
jgi:hypothetical protein